MVRIVSDKPYEFVPPHYGHFWPWLLNRFAGYYNRRTFGLFDVQYRDLQRLRDSLTDGHGILIAPNHCRSADPLIISMLSHQIRQPFFTMASSHLFRDNKLQRWLIRRTGGFSVYREGTDRAAVNTAVDILANHRRPLVIFPEGMLSRSNDLLNPLQEGVPFIARSAAKKRLKRQKKNDEDSANNPAKLGARFAKRQSGKIVIHPVAIKYMFKGDLDATVSPVLDDIEQRLSWQAQSHLSLFDRLYKLGDALLSLKELEFLGQTQSGDFTHRLAKLIDHILVPMEEQYLGKKQLGAPFARVKKLRSAIVPDMIEGDLDEPQRQQRWTQIDHLYLVQQLGLFPENYLASSPTVDRILETVEKFEHGLGVEEPAHAPMNAIVQIGRAIEVDPKNRPRGKNIADPLLISLEEQLQSMLDGLAGESRMYEGSI
jgi:1-acyl-sn-glycerol-3-phosphate acyltransferase